jgi:hypothetical protein
MTKQCTQDQPVAWRLLDEEATAHYGKDIYVYYDKKDFAPGVDPQGVFAFLEPLYTRGNHNE